MSNQSKRSVLLIIIGSARLSNLFKRRMVSCSMALSLPSGKYCFGYCLRDSGQRRVPEPPERITGIMLDKMYF